MPKGVNTGDGGLIRKRGKDKGAQEQCIESRN